MSEMKVRLSITIPGAVMLSSQECDKNPKENYEHHSMEVCGQGKKDRETIRYDLRKSKEAKQAISISKEAYDYMTSSKSLSSIPHSFINENKIEMKKFREDLQYRLKVHFDIIAEQLGGKVDSYEILDD